MPPLATGTAYRLAANRWGLRYRDANGQKHRKSPFPSKSAALKHYRDVIRPQLLGAPAPMPDITLAEFIPLYLERHATSVRPRTISTLAERLGHAERTFGTIPLRQLAGMASQIAGWRARQPEGVRYARLGALRQCLAAGVDWGYLDRNPAKVGRNRQPPPRTVRVFDRDELDRIASVMPAAYATLPQFAAATGLRPSEWSALERRDIDRRAGLLTVARTISDGVVTHLGKTTRSRRQVPLSPRALAALDALPPRLDTPLLWPAPGGEPLDTHNFRSRVWIPAIKAAQIATPARIYDLRCTFASNALAAAVSAFELSRVMGTSVAMIERSYGVLLDGAGAGIASRLAAFEDEQDRTTESFGPLLDHEPHGS